MEVLFFPDNQQVYFYKDENAQPSETKSVGIAQKWAKLSSIYLEIPWRERESFYDKFDDLSFYDTQYLGL